MDGSRFRSWSWMARRGAISAFLIFHVTATVIWVLPPCPLRAASFHALKYYILPLGLWQYWGMFAPDPMRETLTLEAEVLDSSGIRREFAFTKVADYSPLAGVPRFRHSKFAANLILPDQGSIRKLAARHVARSLELPESSYPISVRLYFQVVACPPPGTPPGQPSPPPKPYILGNFTFENREEAGL